MTKSIHTDEMVALRDWLKLQRQSRHLTMRSLAQLMGKPHSYIQRVEDGELKIVAAKFSMDTAIVEFFD